MSDRVDALLRESGASEELRAALRSVEALGDRPAPPARADLAALLAGADAPGAADLAWSADLGPAHDHTDSGGVSAPGIRVITRAPGGRGRGRGRRGRRVVGAGLLAAAAVLATVLVAPRDRAVPVHEPASRPGPAPTATVPDRPGPRLLIPTPAPSSRSGVERDSPAADKGGTGSTRATAAADRPGTGARRDHAGKHDCRSDECRRSGSGGRTWDPDRMRNHGKNGPRMDRGPDDRHGDARGRNGSGREGGPRDSGSRDGGAGPGRKDGRGGHDGGRVDDGHARPGGRDPRHGPSGSAAPGAADPLMNAPSPAGAARAGLAPLPHRR